MNTQQRRLKRGTFREQPLAQREEAEFRSLFENAAAGLFRKSRSGGFLLVNTALARMFGYPTPDAFLAESKEAGHSLFADPQAFAAMVHKLLTLGVVNNAELRIIPRAPEGARPAAAAEWIAVTARAVYTSKGSIRHFEGTVTDITRCKTARMRAAQLQEQLEQARSLECAGVLARALAEDIGGLLEPIVQQTQSALNTLPAHSPAHTALDQALTASTEARGQLYRMLEFCRELEPPQVPVSFTAVVKECLRTLRGKNQDEKDGEAVPVKITADLDAREDVVKGNARLLRRAVCALVKYAADSCSGRTGPAMTLRLRTIDMETAAAAAHPPHTCTLPAGRHICLTFSGSGAHALPQGCTACPPWSTHGKPSLAMVQGIVKLHNGILCQGPDEGGVATLCLYLPALGVADSARTAAGPAPRLGSERILVVDTDHSERNQWRALLGPLGYRMETRPGPVEGLRLFMESPESFDLVITAYAMPQLNGLEFARTLTGIRPDIPVALCLSAHDTVTPDSACAAGACRLARKPLDGAARTRLVELMLSRNTDKTAGQRSWPRFSS
jgi:PAS domain S-box-containing protein